MNKLCFHNCKTYYTKRYFIWFANVGGWSLRLYQGYELTWAWKGQIDQTNSVVKFLGLSVCPTAIGSNSNGVCDPPANSLSQCLCPIRYKNRRSLLLGKVEPLPISCIPVSSFSPRIWNLKKENKEEKKKGLLANQPWGSRRMGISCRLAQGAAILACD